MPRTRFKPTVLAAAILALTPWAALSQEATSTKQLSEVVVTASGFEQAIADAPASITVITKEQLEGKHYRDITDALQDIPGVSIEGGAGGKIESTSINIRGLGEDYVLFLIDGRPLGSSSQAYYNGFGGAAQVGWLPPMSAIERIEVIRGPMSSLYGSSALGGVINVITKKVSDKWSGGVSVDSAIQENSDASNSYQARYYLSGPLIKDKLGLMLYGSKYHRDEDDFIGGYAKKKRVDNTAKLNWRVTDAQTLGFEAGLAKHENLRTAKTGAAGDMDNERTHFALTHDIAWGNGINTNSFITHEKVEIENGSNYSEYRNAVFNTKTVIALNAHMITVGGEYRKEETDHDASRFPGSLTLNLERWQSALFVEDEYFLTNDFSITGGLRYDRNEHYGTQVTPRLYGVYHLNPQWALKGGVSGGYKTPTLKQADDKIVEQAARGAAWDMGNTNLEPERSTNYEIGTTWTSPSKASFGLTFYHTRYKDKISTHTICTSPASAPSCTYNGEVRQRINQYINLDSATLQGLEAAFSMPLGPVKLSTSYTYSDSEITTGPTKGNPLNNLPRHMVNLGLDWKVSDRMNVWGKAKFKSKTLEDGTSQRPAYTLVDIGTTYRFSGNVMGFAGIYNLFDREVTTADYGKTLDGRRLFVGMNLDF